MAAKDGQFWAYFGNSREIPVRNSKPSVRYLPIPGTGEKADRLLVDDDKFCDLEVDWDRPLMHFPIVGTLESVKVQASFVVQETKGCRNVEFISLRSLSPANDKMWWPACRPSTDRTASRRRRSVPLPIFLRQATGQSQWAHAAVTTSRGPVARLL